MNICHRIMLQAPKSCGGMSPYPSHRLCVHADGNLLGTAGVAVLVDLLQSFSTTWANMKYHIYGASLILCPEGNSQMHAFEVECAGTIVELLHATTWELFYMLMVK